MIKLEKEKARLERERFKAEAREKKEAERKAKVEERERVKKERLAKKEKEEREKQERLASKQAEQEKKLKYVINYFINSKQLINFNKIMNFAMRNSEQPTKLFLLWYVYTMCKYF